MRITELMRRRTNLESLNFTSYRCFVGSVAGLGARLDKPGSRKPVWPSYEWAVVPLPATIYPTSRIPKSPLGP